MATGESDLETLLGSMEPRLLAQVYVFASLPEGAALPETAEPLMSFHEAEGTTLILEEAVADRLGISGSFPCRMISLTIHSALESVGFLAVIARHLAAEGISMNAVSAFYHDHLFVPVDRAEEALALLLRLAEEHRERS